MSRPASIGFTKATERGPRSCWSSPAYNPPRAAGNGARRQARSLAPSRMRLSFCRQRAAGFFYASTEYSYSFGVYISG